MFLDRDLTEESKDLFGASAKRVGGKRPALARLSDGPAHGLVGEVAIDHGKAILDVAPCRNLVLRCKQGVQISP